MPTCLYCRETKDVTLFNREHVVPESFGKFEGNFVLKNVVCTDCNTYFGNTIDLKLARESIEGLDRYETEMKRPVAKTKFGTTTTLTARINDGGFHHGAEVFWGASADHTRLVLLPFPQFGISDGRQTVWFRAEQLPAKQDLSSHGFVAGTEISIKPFGVDQDSAAAQLESLGYVVSSVERLGETVAGSDIDIWMSGSIDRLLRRAVSKIAYNYLAYHYLSIAQMEQFAAVCGYVRYDDNLVPEPVSLSQVPLVAGVTPGRSPVAHAVAVEWKNGQVLGHVTLFFRFRYVVVLADGGFVIEPMVVSRGHIFDPDSGQISELTSDPTRGRPLVPPPE